MIVRRIVLVFALACVAALPLHAQLPDTTQLLPDQPWAVADFNASDDSADWELLQADGADLAPTARVTVTEVPTNHWEIGFSWDTVAPTVKGDTLVLSLEARAEGDGNPPGRMHLAFRRVEKPYHHALGESYAVGGEWKQYCIPLSPSVNMPEGRATFRLNLGTQKQTVEIRNLSLLNYGSEVSYLALCRMLDIDPGAGGRQPVGRHLTPDLLWEMRVFDDLPPPDPDFDPVGVWEQRWRIWSCYGYLHRANQNLGVLTITRIPDGDAAFELDVEQSQLNTEGQQHSQSARIICAPDAIATPRSWDYTSSFIGPEGDEMPNLRVERSVDQTPEGPVAAHWGLFEAVQRLPFEEGIEYRFDVLDCLDARKTGHRLRYDGAHEIRFGTEAQTLHRFVQTGHGALPFEYWLDGDHRLVMVISEYRVYVLDAAAVDTFEDAHASQQSRYERLKQRYAPDAEDDDGE